MVNLQNVTEKTQDQVFVCGWREVQREPTEMFSTSVNAARLKMRQNIEVE